MKRREAGENYVENLLEAELTVDRLGGSDRGLCQELVYGVVRWQGTLDWLIARKTQGRTQKPLLQIILRVGLYQMFWLDRIPDHAAVHETVELAKQHGFGPQAGFVNAVLRGYGREMAETKQLLEDLKVSEPWVGYSHPEWLWRRWVTRWGAEAATRLMSWNNGTPRMYARVNTLRGNANQLIEQWRAEAVVYDFRQWDWTGEHLVFELKEHPPLFRMASFTEGKFYVQDPSTLLAVQVLDPQPGESIMDLCAAPGGKTTYMAQRMQDKGRILALDNQPDRLKLIEENCRRLGVTCVQTGTSASPGAGHDRVLVDAPCSNTGVMGRRVDLRWRIRTEELERLRNTQAELLRQAAQTLKPGGTLVYSTCSLEPEENAGVVEGFLKEHPEFELQLQRELTPIADGVDGAFVARLKKQ